MPVPERNWSAVLERIVAGDRQALVEASRLVNSFLVRWNAYSVRDEWEDVVQEVVCAAALALRDGRLRDRDALAGFLKSTTRFKYLDRLRRQLGRAPGERLALEELLDEPAPETLLPEAREDLERALREVPDKPRYAVLAVYFEGRTYQEAAQAAGVPLGTFKRQLRDGLAQLRSALRGILER